MKVPTVENRLRAGFERTKRRVVDERLHCEHFAKRGGEYRGGLGGSGGGGVPPGPGRERIEERCHVERHTAGSHGYPSTS